MQCELFLLGMAIIISAFTARADQPIPEPHDARQFEEMQILAAWEKYWGTLTWGKGQTLAVLDDSCDLDIPEWQVEMEWGPKVIAAWNSVENNNDPRPVGRAYHGTTMGFPSSLNFEGKAGIAFNNHIAPVRCVKRVYIKTEVDDDSRVHSTEMDTLRRGLEWVLENADKYNITAVNFAPLDGAKHTQPVHSPIDDVLQKLRAANIWVSAPCGNSGSAELISWPAISPYCYAIGASGPISHHPYDRDRNVHTDLLARAGATSSSNAYAAACAMILREAIEKSGYDWQSRASNLPDAMMQIFQETGITVTDSTTGLSYPSLQLLNALDYVFANSSANKSG